MVFWRKNVTFARQDFEQLVSLLPKSAIAMHKSSLIEAETFLKEDESPFHVEPVNIGMSPGILVVTDKRIYFVHKLMGQINFKQLPFDTISNVKMGSVSIGTLEIHTVHEDLKITAIHRKRVKDVFKTIINHTN